MPPRRHGVLVDFEVIDTVYPHEGVLYSGRVTTEYLKVGQDQYATEYREAWFLREGTLERGPLSEFEIPKDITSSLFRPPPSQGEIYNPPRPSKKSKASTSRVTPEPEIIEPSNAELGDEVEEPMEGEIPEEGEAEEEEEEEQEEMEEDDSKMEAMDLEARLRDRQNEALKLLEERMMAPPGVGDSPDLNDLDHTGEDVYLEPFPWAFEARAEHVDDEEEDLEEED